MRGSKPNIRTNSGTLNYNDATGYYEGEYYSHYLTPELARAIRTYKVTPYEYNALQHSFFEQDSDEGQRRAVEYLKGRARARAEGRS